MKIIIIDPITELQEKKHSKEPFIYLNSKNQKGDMFGLSRVRKIVKENRNSRPEEISRLIHEKFASFMGLSSPESDVVVIVFKIF